ncbi:FLYWCH zinc finger domain-containing protein [Ditylenchus destructor]|uniref:FLYWCH zinc finger domain-containing protein n=1 Tax=Ditylenchus destructor TaxID=166010 RepID=A0AAD4MFM1_9BILA|nr:FLYWCH zinc finger domain-containing protein [Ditylenchus destructor]
MYPDLDFSSLLAEDQGDFPMDDESHDESSYENDDEPPNEIDERPRLVMTEKKIDGEPLYKLIFQNYLYWKSKETVDGKKTIWRCVKRDRRCTGTLHTLNSNLGVVHGPTQHNHGPDAAASRMIPALSFVRLNDVKQYAATLFETLPDCLDQVASWFEHNYIGAEVRRGGRMVQIQPRFPHQLWNVHQRTIDGQHRTNNYAEAGNRRIQSEMGMETPTMGYFIDRLKLIQRGRDQAHVRWL